MTSAPSPASSGTVPETIASSSSTLEPQTSAPTSYVDSTGPSARKTPKSSAGRLKSSIKKPFRSPLPVSGPATTTVVATQPNVTVSAQTPSSIRSRTFSSRANIPLLTSPAPTSMKQRLLNEKRKLEREVDELEGKIRKIGLLKAYNDKDEAAKVDSLILKWQAASRQAIATIRDSIGPVMVPAPVTRQQGDLDNECQSESEGDFWNDSMGSRGAGWYGGFRSSMETLQPRVLTIKEVCTRFGLEVEKLGDYDEESDCFRD
ncbi:hypothetical protein HK102_008605 [Quaeritorhiza haematococci]|nr:hypothetical protein HK102_008605 [Quaeritorhiza haematococci]